MSETEISNTLLRYEALVLMHPLNQCTAALTDQNLKYLFDSAKEFEAAVERNSPHDWAPRDHIRFREKLSLVLRPLIDSWHTEQSKWGAQLPPNLRTDT